MPVSERRVEEVRRFAGERVVVTAEHASNSVPKGLKPGLGVGAAVLRTHVAWDPGARELASILAHRLGAAQFMGRQTRLVVDLNRGRGSRHLIPKHSFGVDIPGNMRLTRKQRDERIAKFWQPYRDAVQAAVERAIERGGECLHFGVHTFTPALDGQMRDVEVGLLFDPPRPREQKFAVGVRAELELAGVVTRLNYPSQGTADGLTTSFRAAFPKSRYIGIDIEVNQAAVETSRQRWRVGRVLADAIAAVIEI